jgi:hypothetical protein
MRIHGVQAACLAAAVTAILFAGGPAGAAVSWTVVPPPPPAGAIWSAVSARTDSDAWAIAIGSATAPLTARWNGTSWSQVPGPVVPGDISAVPYAVSASSATDAWLVGRGTKFRNQVTTLAAHWNGTSWSVVPAPGHLMRSVVDISPTDAYAVGQTVALHWDGSAWSTIAVPVPGGAAPVTFDAVAADSATDVWVTGVYFDPVTSADQPFTAHWNGTTWTSVPVPANQAELFGLTAVSSGDAWAVGETGGNPVTENWDGSTWRVVPNPVQGTPGNLASVTNTGPGNVTAVGHNSTANGPTAAFILAWNGSSWVSDIAPVVGATEQLYSASAAPGGSVTWALGSSTSSGGVVSSLLLRNG